MNKNLKPNTKQELKKKLHKNKELQKRLQIHVLRVYGKLGEGAAMNCFHGLFSDYIRKVRDKAIQIERAKLLEI